MNILFIDHYDSFSNNIISFFSEKNINVQKIFHTDINNIDNLSKYQAIIFSPGPGSPHEYQDSLRLYHSLPPHIPVLGICLGLQIMLCSDGGLITQAYPVPHHGKQLQVKKNISSELFGKMKLDGTLVLYHSLGFKICDQVFQQWKILLEYNNICLMAEHKNKMHLGLQFHPESFASTIGYSILNSFLRVIQK